jgi:hypothetical protein
MRPSTLTTADASMSGVFIDKAFRCRTISSVLLAIQILLRGRQQFWSRGENELAIGARIIQAAVDGHLGLFYYISRAWATSLLRGNRQMRA